MDNLFNSKASTIAPGSPMLHTLYVKPPPHQSPKSNSLFQFWQVAKDAPAEEMRADVCSKRLRVHYPHGGAD
jgi:hypothetical protein